MKKFFIILSAAFGIVSCRSLVLENRVDCPSFLYFDIENSERFEDWDSLYVNVYAHPNGSLIDEAKTIISTVQTEDRSKKFYFVVKGTEAVKGYGLLGQDGLIQDGTSWVTPLGSEYAPLFRFSYIENVQEESFTVPVEFVKDYCHVKVQFVGYETFTAAMGRFPFDILIRSNTSGIDALTGIPMRSPFEFRPEEKKVGFFEFNLPRLGDQNLTMELYGREGLAERTGHTATFDLYADLLNQGGLTWTEKNLPDVDIIIDYQEHTVNINVCAWSHDDISYEY